MQSAEEEFRAVAAGVHEGYSQLHNRQIFLQLIFQLVQACRDLAPSGMGWYPNAANCAWISSAISGVRSFKPASKHLRCSVLG